jgi:hypothetical protein
MMRTTFSLFGFVLSMLYASEIWAQVPIFADGFESGDTSAWSVSVPGLSGRSCDLPADVSNASFPYMLLGTFDDDPATGPSCDATVTNTVWFTYTPSASDEYEIITTNNSSTNAYSRLAVFEGTGCDPYGTELDCQTSSSKTVTSTTLFNAGTSYLIMFFTDGESYTMVDPEIEIVSQSSPPGTTCTEAADVSAETFPYQLVGTFDDDPAMGPSCDTTVTNTVWFTYTPSASDEYEIITTNNTSTNAYSRLAVFEGTGCDPYGTELDCQTSSSKTVTSTTLFNAGTSYLIMFFTDGESYTMVDPEIDITTVP